MGYYIETGSTTGKANWLVNNHEAKRISASDAKEAFRANKGIVCVIDNGLFEAAGFAYSDAELDVFMHPDGRSKTWLEMDRAKAEQLSKYR